MPKFYCDYCDTYLTHDSPSVRKTHCSGRKHKENVKDYYQKWMEEQAQSLIDKTTRENPPDTILGTAARRSHDPTAPQHPWPPTAWHDASPSHGWTTNDANDGPSPTRNDASWTCSRDEAANGRTHANDARAPNDETTLQTHDGANQARNDPARQIKVDMELPFLLHLLILHTIKFPRPLSLGFCTPTVCRDLLLHQLADALAWAHTGLILLYLVWFSCWFCLLGFPPTLNGEMQQ